MRNYPIHPSRKKGREDDTGIKDNEERDSSILRRIVSMGGGALEERES